MSIEMIPAYEQQEEIAAMFREYTDLLLEGDTSIGGFLEKVDYHGEARHLRDKYPLPGSCFYLLFCDGRAAGCVGLKKLDEECCEMKRLYVRPEFRRRHLGEFLVEQVMVQARAKGYTWMYLDTLPFLKEAICLYKKYGFDEIPPYKGDMAKTSLYMRASL